MTAAGKGNSHDAVIEAIMGSSGCGKSTHLKKRLGSKKRNRTIIWSPKEAIDDYASMYPGSVVVTTAGEVLKILKAAGPRGGFHIVYRPRLNRKIDAQQFNVVCKLAKAARNLTFVVEELHTVTLPSWAPDGWSELVMIGRAYGIEVFALSQRPASVDKDFFGNISSIHVGRMAYDDDAKVVAKALRVAPEDVLALTGYDWIETNKLTGKTLFSNKSAKKIPAKRAG